LLFISIQPSVRVTICSAGSSDVLPFRPREVGVRALPCSRRGRIRSPSHIPGLLPLPMLW
jgi:hypothetical protein